MTNINEENEEIPLAGNNETVKDNSNLVLFISIIGWIGFNIFYYIKFIDNLGFLENQLIIRVVLWVLSFFLFLISLIKDESINPEGLISSVYFILFLLYPGYKWIFIWLCFVCILFSWLVVDDFNVNNSFCLIGSFILVSQNIFFLF